VAQKEQIAIRLPPDAVQWLKARASSEERSRASVIARLIREEMAREAKAKAKKPKPKS
jgi:hypothetical protein